MEKTMAKMITQEMLAGWGACAKVSAKSKPENLFGGFWVEPASDQKEVA